MKRFSTFHPKKDVSKYKQPKHNSTVLDYFFISGSIPQVHNSQLCLRLYGYYGQQFQPYK